LNYDTGANVFFPELEKKFKTAKAFEKNGKKFKTAKNILCLPLSARCLPLSQD
jgi:hypothetical protein